MLKIAAYLRGESWRNWRWRRIGWPAKHQEGGVPARPRLPWRLAFAAAKCGWQPKPAQWLTAKLISKIK